MNYLLRKFFQILAVFLLTLSSFGVTTGGLNLRNQAFDGLFDPRRLTAHLLGRDRIYSVAFDRLTG